MKRVFYILLFIFLTANAFVLASPVVYSDNELFGLKNDSGEIIVEAKYKKLIKIEDNGWIFQSGSRFGIMRDDGEIVVKPIYTNAERVVGRFAKFKKGSKYAIFDDAGFAILPPEFSSIDLLFGGMFLTCKNYKYGIYDFNGQLILDNIFDDIYMPNPKTLILVYNGVSYELERKDGDPISLPVIIDNEKITINEFISNPAIYSGYYGVTATNYVLKLVSAISPAYENTIDELVFQYGADTVSVLMKLSWIPKFPFIYAKNYYEYLKAPNNGPLSSLKNDMKRKIK